MDTQPLFGETKRRYKAFNIVVAVVTTIVVTFTVVMGILSSVFFPDHDKCKRLGYKSERFCVSGVDVVMCFVIILELIPEVALAFWYRRGELEPKFRTLIYYNAVVTILLCLVANFYFFQLGQKGFPTTITPTTTTGTATT
eukprot:Em0001g2116a